VTQRLQAKEWNQLLEVVDNKYDPEQEKYDRSVLENYLRERKKEAAVYQKQQTERRRKKTEIEKFGLNDKSLDKERLKYFNKKESRKKEE
ncbi:11936_t:CDS:1, partial [Cetraspora pellucida]